MELPDPNPTAKELQRRERKEGLIQELWLQSRDYQRFTEDLSEALYPREWEFIHEALRKGHACEAGALMQDALADFYEAKAEEMME